MPTPGAGKKDYWFPAKKYGWGWGFPSVWQGWLALLLYLGAILLSGYLFPPARKTTAFILSTAVISGLFLVVCWIKGEPPGWRWGGRSSQ
jgi:hypothetical protein